MMHKKAVSPLIATVLLIAFAVALGAVVMNWSFKYAPQVNTCESVQVSFELIQGRPDICFDSQQQSVKYTLRNGVAPVEGLKITIIGAQDSFQTEQEFLLDQNSIKKFTTTYDALQYGTPKKIIIQPYLIHSDGENVCQESSISSESIPLC